MDLSRQRRRVDHIRGKPIGVVLDHLVVELDDPDKVHLVAPGGRHSGCSKAGQRGLTGGVEPDGYDLTDADPHEPRAEARRHELVRSTRISNPSLERMDAVLVEVQPRLATGEIDLVGNRQVRCPVGLDRNCKYPHPTLHVRDGGQSGDGPLGCWRVLSRVAAGGGTGAVRRHRQVRRICPHQVCRVGRLGATGELDRRHGGAPEKTDEEGKDDAALPPQCQYRPEAIPQNCTGSFGHGSGCISDTTRPRANTGFETTWNLCRCPGPRFTVVMSSSGQVDTPEIMTHDLPRTQGASPRVG